MDDDSAWLIALIALERERQGAAVDERAKGEESTTWFFVIAWFVVGIMALFLLILII